MTFLHLLSSCLATFGPFIVLYKAHKLADDSRTLSIIFFSLGIQVFVQAVKTIGLISFVSPAEQSYIVPGMMKHLLHLLDFAGLAYLLSSKKPLLRWSAFGGGSDGRGRGGRDSSGGTGEGGRRATAKLVATVVGWSGGHAILHNFFPILAGAFSGPFSWEYLHRGIATNLNLVMDYAYASMIFARRRDVFQDWVDPLLGLSVVMGYLGLPMMESAMRLARNDTHRGRYSTVGGKAEWQALTVHFAVAILVATVAWVSSHASSARAFTASPSALKRKASPPPSSSE